MKARARICALVVTHNRVRRLEICLKALLAEDAIQRVVVVDNASTDGTGSWLRALETTKLLPVSLDENTGGAGGFAAGMREAFRLDDELDWLLLLDDDAWPAAGAIGSFADRDYPADVVSIASAVYLPSGEISRMNRPGFKPFRSAGLALRTLLLGSDAFHVGPDRYRSSGLTPVDFSSFVGFFIRMDVAKQLGVPRADWFLYGDDLEYILRIGDLGHQHNFDPEVRFVHDCDTLVDNTKIYDPMWRAYFTYRNGIFIYRRIAGRYFIIVLTLKMLEWLMATRHYHAKAKYLKLLCRAVYDGLAGRTDRARDLLDPEPV